MKVDSGKIVRT